LDGNSLGDGITGESWEVCDGIFVSTRGHRSVYHLVLPSLATYDERE